MHVDPEYELLASDEPQRRDQVAVPGPGDDPLVLPHRERMGSGGRDHHPLGPRRVVDLAAQRPQLIARLVGVGARVGRDLEHRFHQLGLDLAGGGRLEQRLDRVDQLERLPVEDHQLLFDPDRVRRARKLVFHGGAA